MLSLLQYDKNDIENYDNDKDTNADDGWPSRSLKLLVVCRSGEEIYVQFPLKRFGELSPSGAWKGSFEHMFYPSFERRTRN